MTGAIDAVAKFPEPDGGKEGRNEQDEIARDLKELRDVQAVDDGTRYTHEQVLEELGLSSDSLRR